MKQTNKQHKKQNGENEMKKSIAQLLVDMMDEDTKSKVKEYKKDSVKCAYNSKYVK